MSLIIPANSAAASGGYVVANSCRFDGTSAYLSRTQGTPTDIDKYTISVWFKRSALFNGSYQNIIGTDHQSVREAIRFNDDADSLTWDFKNASNTKSNITPNQLFRDVASWYNLVCIFDSANGTANLRRRIFLNGTEITSFAAVTYNAQNEDGNLNKGGQNIVIGIPAAANNFFSGYMSEFVFVDGQALTPDGNFGEFDEDSGIWKPIDVSGLTFGTNGFYLDFEDSANLGNDANGGTDLTEVNLAAIDQSTDTCTNNFATLNPLDNFFAGSTLAEGNCKVTYLSGSGKYGYNTGTIALTSGKWYHEIKIVQSAGSNYNMFGIEEDVCQSVGHEYLSSSTGYVLNGNNGKIIARGTEVTYGNATAVNDIIGVYIDLDNNKLYFAENGTIMNSGTGQTIAAASATKHGYYFVLGGDYSSGTVGIHEFNFGNPIFTGTDKTDANGYGSFEYDPSAGTFDSASKDFYALCTKNLAEYG